MDIPDDPALLGEGLVLAAGYGNGDAVTKILCAAADKISDHDKRLALDMAVARGHKDIVKSLFIAAVPVTDFARSRGWSQDIADVLWLASRSCVRGGRVSVNPERFDEYGIELIERLERKGLLKKYHEPWHFGTGVGYRFTKEVEDEYC